MAKQRGDSNVIDMIDPAPIVASLPKPARLKALSQEHWDAIAPVLQSEIIRMLRELTIEFETVRAAAKRDSEMKEFHALAEAGGTTVAKAFRGYVDTENLIRADPVAGICRLLENLGVDPIEWARTQLETNSNEVA